MSTSRRAALAVLVRLQAFQRAPVRYLQGIVWRARGMKVRSRHRLSELMGSAPHAYQLWIATREVHLHAALADVPSCAPPLTIVVDARESGAGLERTLHAVEQAGLVARRRGGWNLRDVLVLGDAAIPPAFAGNVRTLPSLETLRSALAASGEIDIRPWILTLKAGDRLAPVALLAYAAALLAYPKADLLYADDDLVRDDGDRHTPHFKPEWNGELARHHDFLTDSCVFACDPAAIDGAWPEDAIRACTSPQHVALVLHHRRARPLPVIPPARRSLPQGLSPMAQELPHVSIIVPTRNHGELLRMCMEGLAATRYPSFDVTIIDNGSDEPDTLAYLEEISAAGVRVVSDPSPFNYAAMHNAVVGALRGPLICFLNNDIEIPEPQWLETMAIAALRPDTGAVGARLLYPDGTIQHAGIVMGVGGGAAHAHRFLAPDQEGYFARAYVPQFVSAVTAACLLLEKSKFEAVGGFDAANFAVAFNDVDLCLKLTARGWKSFYEPRAVLIHHESKSRGTDDTPEKKHRFAGELSALKRIWHTDVEIDPYHHPELSPYSEHFVVRL
nr:hypothetical protein TQ38_27560 [Novosphingobium sp. P6W]